MQPMRWTVLIRYEGAGQDGELRDVGCFVRPVDRAAPADFGLSLTEGRTLLRHLQSLVTQDQIRAYDIHRRRCRHCGRYRAIKDWRPRQFDTVLGRVRVP